MVVFPIDLIIFSKVLIEKLALNPEKAFWHNEIVKDRASKTFCMGLGYLPVVNEVDFGKVMASVEGVFWPSLQLRVAPMEMQRMEIISIA